MKIKKKKTDRGWVECSRVLIAEFLTDEEVERWFDEWQIIADDRYEYIGIVGQRLYGASFELINNGQQGIWRVYSLGGMVYDSTNGSTYLVE